MGLGTKAYLVGAILTFYSSFAAALGLGEITLNSALNQPLDAEIQLLHVRDLSEREIRVGLASSEDFARAGVDRSYFLTSLNFSVDLNAADGPLVRVTSENPVREPFINFLVSARWPSGRLLREYTLLVDLPVFSGEEAAPVQAAPRQQPTTGERSTASPNQPAGPQSTQPASSGEEYGPVGANENLWSIASRVRPDSSVTVQQTMLALQRLNPQAFINDNINLLRRGQVLRVPSKSDIQSVPPQQAVSEVANQNRRWNQGTEAETSPQLEGSRSIEPTRSEPSAPEGRVSLSSSNQTATQGDATGAGEDDAGAIRNRLAVTQEELDAASRENADLQSRLGSVEEQIETLEKLVEVSSEELRSLEVAAQQTNAAEAEEDSAAEDQQASVDQTESVEATQVEQESEQEPTAAPQQTTEQSSWLDLVMANILYIALALGAVVVAIALWLYMRGRDDGFADEFEDDLGADYEQDYEPTLAPGPVDDDPTVAVVPHDQSTTDEAPEKTEVVNEAETEDVVGECDIHIAYGQYEQAEEKLTRALNREPNNVAMRVKLLEVFAAQNDVASFDRHYAKLHELDDQAALDRAATLRHDIDAAEPFDLAAQGASAVDESADGTYDATDTQIIGYDSEASGDAIADDTLQFDLESEADSSSVGFDDNDEGLALDLDDQLDQADDATVVQNRSQSVESDEDLSLDLDDDDTQAVTAAVTPAAVDDHDHDLEQELDASLDAIEESIDVERQGESVEPDIAVGAADASGDSAVLADLEFDLDEMNADLSFDDVELDLEFASFDSFTDENDDTRIANPPSGFDLPEEGAEDLAVHTEVVGDSEFTFDETLEPVSEGFAKERGASSEEHGATVDDSVEVQADELPTEGAREDHLAIDERDEAIPADFDLELQTDIEPADLSDGIGEVDESVEPGEGRGLNEDFLGNEDSQQVGTESDFDGLDLTDLGDLDIDDEQIDGGDAATFDLGEQESELANNLVGEPLTGDSQEDDAEAIAQSLEDAGPIDDDGETTPTKEAGGDDFELEGDLDLDDLDRDLDSLTSDFDGGFASTDALMDEPVTDFGDFEFDGLDLEDEEKPRGNDLPGDVQEPSAASTNEPSAEGTKEPSAESTEEPLANTNAQPGEADAGEESVGLDDIADHLGDAEDDTVSADEIADESSLSGFDSAADFEIPDFDPESDDDSNLDFLSDNDETATKLDLARAYIDMGDADGAKDILDEIMEEGNDQQKQEAEMLLSQLA